MPDAYFQDDPSIFTKLPSELEHLRRVPCKRSQKLLGHQEIWFELFYEVWRNTVI